MHIKYHNLIKHVSSIFFYDQSMKLQLIETGKTCNLINVTNCLRTYTYYPLCSVWHMRFCTAIANY